jgi:hypothetical protein
MKYILLLSFLWSGFNYFSQDQKPPAFVSKVYNDLYSNLYITRKVSKPELVYVTDNSSMIIKFEPNQGEKKMRLIIGSELVSLIRTFQADSMNALAFIMGHEMAHIFLDQYAEFANIGSGYADKTLKKKLGNDIDSTYTEIWERQADEKAMFYAHIGGYKTTHVAEKVLEKVYSHPPFKLKPNLPGYPILKERLEIVRSSSLKMKLLLERFELANLCFVSRNYDVASNIFEAIINSGFKSSEMYNNLGLCHVMKVIQSDSSFQRYEWPIFLSSKTKLISSTQRDIFEIDVKETLYKAIEQFNLTIGDKEAKYAYLNLSIAHFLLDISKEDQENDNIQDATNYLNKLSNSGLTNYKVLKGILAHYQGNSEESKEILFEESKISSMAKRNFDVLFGTTEISSNNPNPLESLLPKENSLKEIFLDSKVELIQDPSNKGISPILPSFKNITIDTKITKNISCFKINDKSLNKRLFFGKSGIEKLKLSQDQLTDCSDYIIQTDLFTYYVYQDNILQMDSSKNFILYKFN